MNPKIVPILQRIIESDHVVRAFAPDNLPQAAESYLWKSYARGDTFLSHDEQEDLESHLLPCGNSCVRETFRADASADASRFHLFEDDSLLIETNAYQQIWSDARDFVVECILPQMRLSLMDAELLRAIDMGHVVESVRDDFFHAFAQTLHKSCGIPHCDAWGHWQAFVRQLSATEAERCELGGSESGAREGMLFAETFKFETVNA